MPNVVIEFKKDSCQVLHSTVPEVEKPRRTRLLKRELSCKSAKTERHPLIRSQPRSDNAKQTVLSLFKLYFPLKHTFAGGLRDNNSRGLWASLCNKRTLHPKHTTHPRKNPPLLGTDRPTRLIDLAKKTFAATILRGLRKTRFLLTHS
jgi:hypothetical protein